jgi:acyl-coenzyme A synthetase/AMP-(fatty) acid ligase
MASVFDHIAFQARVRPDGFAVLGLAGPVTFARLVHDAEGLATDLLEHGLTPRDMVGLNIGYSYLHVLLVLALDRLGIPSMSFPTANPAVPPTMRPEFGVTTVITSGAIPTPPPGRCIEMREEHRPQIGKSDPARLAQIVAAPGDMVRLTWTSGSTGSSKGSPMDRAIQQLRLTALRKLRALGPGVRYLAAMPLSSGYCYAMMLAVLCGGGAIVLPDPSIDLVTRANTLGVTATGTPPSMLTELLGREGDATRRLATVAFFDVVGAHLPSRLARETLLHLTPNLCSTYGSTEGGWAATAGAAVCIDDPSAVGYRIPWMAVQAVDAADRPVPPGTEGVLRIKGDQVVMRYHGDEATTRRVFRDGWFHPGDLGMVTADGMVRVTGRVEDVIVRDGVAIAPQPIEEAIGALPQVREVAVFPMPGPDGAQQIWAAVVLEPGADPHALAASIRLGERTPARLLVLERLPRNANGKVVRRFLVDLATRSAKP